MRPILFQYQARAEPVFVPAAAPEEITIDKWDPGEVRVRRAPTSSRASFVPSFFFLEDLASAPEVVTLDKWYQPISVPGRQKKRDSYQALFFLEDFAAAPAVPALDSWYRQAAEPRRQRKPFNVQIPTFFYLENFVQAPAPPLDSWYRPASEPRRFRRGIGTSSIPAGVLVEFNVPVPPVVVGGNPIMMMGM